MHKSSEFTGEQVRGLIRRALHGNKDPQQIHRLDGVLLVAEGRSCDEVAGWFGVNRRTVERWVSSAAALGLDGVAEHAHAGRPSTLLDDQREALIKELQGPPAALGYSDRRWTGKRLALHLARCYGLVWSVRNCQRLIAETGHGKPEKP